MSGSGSMGFELVTDKFGRQLQREWSLFIKHLFSEQRIRLREGQETEWVRKPPRKGFYERSLARYAGYELFGESTVRFSEGF